MVHLKKRLKLGYKDNQANIFFMYGSSQYTPEMFHLQSRLMRLCRESILFLTYIAVGSGYGKVDRALESDTRDLRFESRHRQHYLPSTVLKSCVEKTKIKKKEAGNGPIFKRILMSNDSAILSHSSFENR